MWVAWVAGKDIKKKKSFLSTGLPLIIHPLSCVSPLTTGPETATLCNLALISADSQIERRSSEARRKGVAVNGWPGTSL